MIMNLGNTPENNITVVAILSTAVMPIDGTYRIVTLKDQARSIVLNNLDGIAHYIGHPDTRALVEALGSFKASTNLFGGLEVGESVICFPIKQGQSTRATEGYTAHQAIADLNNLDVRVLTRIE